MNLCDIRKKLLEALPQIEEAYICEFGEKHRQEIIKRINSTAIYLENSYYHEETYLNTHTSSYQKEEIKKIKYQAHKEKYQMNFFKCKLNIKIKTIIKQIFDLDITGDDYSDFFDEFFHLEGSLIDYFGIQANEILNDEFTPEEIKLLIYQKQQEFLNKYHFSPTTENVELLRTAISIARNKFFKNIAKNTNFSKSFLTFYENNFIFPYDQITPDEFLYPIITSQFDATLGNFTIISDIEIDYNNEKIKKRLIFIPLAKLLKTYTVDDAILCLIHELGHSVCSNGQLTQQEMYYKKQFNLFLELTNEYRARKVTSKVLNKNYHNNNFSYDLILPLISPFLEKYYHIINELDLLTAPIYSYFDIFVPEFKDLIIHIYHEYLKISFFSYKIINNCERPITYNEKAFKDIEIIIQDITKYVENYHEPKRKKKI